MVGILAIVEPSIAVGAKVAEYLVEPIKSQYVYLFQYKKNIRKLRNEAKTLENMRAGVQLSVDEAKRNLKIIGPDVEAWLRRVDDIQKETELVLLTADKVDNRRWLNYSLSRKALNKIKVIVELQCKSRFDHVSYDPHPPRVTAPTPMSKSEGFESRLSIMKDVMEALQEDKIHLIGICGMGGVGKTTIVKDIAAKVIEERLFDEVVMADVTQSPDLKSIQGSIADFLGLKLVEESLLARAARLCERLKGHTRVLVILDNIWGRLDLEEIGIPPVAKQQHCSCTVMLTSRSADACVEMGAERIFTIKPMPHKEAWVLFQRTADELFLPNLFQVAEDIVVQCGGLPLAIVTIARALRSQKQKFMWDNALHSLQNFNLQSDYAIVYSALEVSYKFLESDELKHLFLLCCLFPQGYDIPIEELFRFGSGLSMFSYMDGVDYARIRANACIQRLKNLNLLLDSRDEECVKMHDLVHTFALSVTSELGHLFWVRHGNGERFWPRGGVEEICTKISLWCEKMHGIPASLEFPKLKLLLLVGSSDLSQFPQNFYEGMRQLKVLIHRGMLINSLPISFQHLSTLQTLSLDYCTFGEECDISMIGDLVNLQILSFVHSNVKEIPAEVGKLTQLRLLDMTGCVELLKITPGVLQNLICLEELYMRGTLLNWPAVQTMTCLSELTSLSFLAALEIELSSFELLPVDMVYERLTRFRICIGFAIESQVFKNTLKLGEAKLWNKSTIHVLFQRAEILLLQGTPYEYSDYPVHILQWSDKENFSKLRTLTIHDCDSLVFLVKTCSSEATNDFTMLESLYLHRLGNLIEIWHLIRSELSSRDITQQKLKKPQQPHSWMSYPQLPSFGNLRVLDIVGCRNLKYVFSLSIVRALVKLESVKIADCWKLEEIFRSEDEIVGVKIELPKLKSLKLLDLPHLTCFCKKADAVVLPELVDLYIVDCWHLKYVFSLSTVWALVKLEIFKIASCPMIEEIFNSEDQKVVVKIELPKLKSLKLINLQDLTRFCKKADEVVLPELVDLELVSLPNFTFTRLTSSDTESKHHASSNHLFLKQEIALGRLTEVSDSTKKVTVIENDIPPTLSDAESVLSSHSIQSLHRLEVLDIASCLSVEVVFDLESPSIEGENKAVVLSSLRILNLSLLQNMTHVWKHGFETFEGFKNLTKMSLSSCDSITYLFSTVIANFLMQLEELVVRSCGKLEVIVKEENGIEMTAEAPSKIVFPRLTSIQFFDLPNLRYFCSRSQLEFEWPVLKSLKIGSCKRMLIFTSGNSSTPSLRVVDKDQWMYRCHGDVNSTLRGVQQKVTPVQKAATTLVNDNMNASSSRSLT